MSVWTLVAVAWVAVFAGCLIGWRLRGSVQARRRGGMLDLTPAASAGELDLDWSDPRDVALDLYERSVIPPSTLWDNVCGPELRLVDNA